MFWGGSIEGYSTNFVAGYRAVGVVYINVA